MIVLYPLFIDKIINSGLGDFLAKVWFGNNADRLVKSQIKTMKSDVGRLTRISRIYEKVYKALYVKSIAQSILEKQWKMVGRKGARSSLKHFN